MRYTEDSPAAVDSEAVSTRRSNLLMPSQCSIPDCDKPTVGRGWCRRHYHRWHDRKGDRGDPAQLRSNRHLDTPWRFWMKVTFTDTCWLWTAMTDKAGYGMFTLTWDRKIPAHRYAYEFCVGPILAGLVIDHQCRVHNCVLPDHLEPITQKENTRRGVGYPSVSQRTRRERVLVGAKRLSQAVLTL